MTAGASVARGRRWRACLAVATAMAAGWSGGRAAAEEAPLTVAVFAPSAPFESGEARFAFAGRVAQQLAAAGVPAQAKAFARASDFEAAVKRGQVQLAIVDGPYLAGRGVPWPVLATATEGGETSARWALYASAGSTVMDLAGKRLAQPASGARDAQLVDNVLLDGELPKLFGARQTAPDLASAVQAVTLKRADCVFAPEGMPRGLRKVFEAVRVPNPALVQVAAALPADVVARVKQALASGGAGGAYDGWRVGGADAYRALAGHFGPKVRRPVMAEPEVVRLVDADVVSAPTLEPSLPDLKDQLWQPASIP